MTLFPKTLALDINLSHPQNLTAAERSEFATLVPKVYNMTQKSTRVGAGASVSDDDSYNGGGVMGDPTGGVAA
ncbi:hypothetical protein Tco_0362135, partial [Tanacetum coccineum]